MGHGKLENVLIEKKGSRKDCFNKRNRGILKKLYQLAYISGCGVHLVIEAEDGNVYEFHRKMNPVLQKAILQASFNSPNPNPTIAATSGSDTLISTFINAPPPPGMGSAAQYANPGPGSASTRPSKITNKRMFFNGVKTMDTGLTISPQERLALMNPASCSCFDCRKGFSNRLVECIDPATYMDQPLMIDDASNNSAHDQTRLHATRVDDVNVLNPTHIMNHPPLPVALDHPNIITDTALPSFTYANPNLFHYNPKNLMASAAALASPTQLGGVPQQSPARLPPPPLAIVKMVSDDNHEDQCILGSERCDSCITKGDQQQEYRSADESAGHDSLAKIFVELPNILGDHIMPSLTDLPSSSAATLSFLSDEFLADMTCFDGTDQTSFLSEVGPIESYFGFTTRDFSQSNGHMITPDQDIVHKPNKLP